MRKDLILSKIQKLGTENNQFSKISLSGITPAERQVPRPSLSWAIGSVAEYPERQQSGPKFIVLQKPTGEITLNKTGPSFIQSYSGDEQALITRLLQKKKSQWLFSEGRGRGRASWTLSQVLLRDQTAKDAELGFWQRPPPFEKPNLILFQHPL